MHRFWAFMVFLCLGCPGMGQTAQPAQADSDPTALTATGVAPGDVVISIDNFCDQDLLLVGTAASSDPKKSGCKTEITRAQFEQMIAMVEPNMKTSNRIRVAVQYPEHLLYSEKARELQLDKDERFLQRLKLNYLQLLAKTYNSYLAQKAGEVSDAEVASYYKDHPETFARVNLLRIFVSNERVHEKRPATPAELDRLRAEDETFMKSVALAIQKRAAAGEDFEKLQAEASKSAGGDPDDIPDVDLGMTTRDEIPQDYRQVFDLKPGQVSETIKTPEGWYICKIVAKDMVPLEQARVLLVRLRLQASTDAAKQSIKTTFNDNYFNTPHGMEPAKSSAPPK